MKLDRNTTADGRDKYALLKLRKLDDFRGTDGAVTEPIAAAIRTLEQAGMLDYGTTPESEFFVLRLKDRWAGGPLMNYAERALADNEDEYAREIMAMAKRAGTNSPFCKKPD